MGKIRRHFTFSNVASGLALFLVISGGTAVALRGTNTVFSNDIVNGQVKPADLAKSAGGQAFGRYRDNFEEIPNGSNATSDPRPGSEDVLTLNLPAGRYVLQAKATEYGVSPGGNGYATCRLYAEGDFDETAAGNGATNLQDGSLAMLVLHTARHRFTTHLACTDLGAGPLYIADRKIVATRVRSIRNRAG